MAKWLEDEVAHERRIESERVSRWQKSISSPPSFDPESLKQIANGMRLSISHRETGLVASNPELERIFMEYLCRAIEAGAFSGNDWLAWRVRLADSPHILHALNFLSDHAPQEHRRPRPAFSVATQMAADVFPGLIESFIKPKERGKSKKRGAPARYDPREDAKIFNAWSTNHHDTFAECARALGGSHTEISVKRAVDRHEKRLRNQAARG